MTVRLKQIVPIYTESISETIKKRMVNCIRNGEDLSKYLVLEKDPNQKRYEQEERVSNPLILNCCIK
ncbi:hypothetical protein [Bacillus paranthracis]|uniref:hypothetical protein n=1 Tax=Bacillus paranthracis TaxID=2026186 RepID=UPI0013D29D54|nr:hypothetical protein [Bacillus paranthracis]MDK7446675.1 hypothetical protein [Bacillus paranthracis]MDN8630729.1 hypothetical protein [Bacillus paranthracis]MDN8637833.1 hypothetical protein [Bacillus paranthracis]HDR7855149.1 hypothetical protein [Bacillus paranthracis]